MDAKTGACWIIGAGEFTPRGLSHAAEDFVIAADAGLKHLEALGLAPDLLVGDLDSLGKAPEGLPLLRHPVEKDDTDMELALNEGATRGYRRFLLYGGSGGRIDHFLANLQLIAHASREGLNAILVCPDFDAYALTDDTLRLPGAPKGTLLSVFCLGEDAQGVSLSGLKYPLNNARLTAFHALGVSNAHTGAPVEICVQSGTLLVLDYAPGGVKG